MEVIRAKRAGACYGVQRALDMADEVIADGSRAYTLGPLIHNPQVVADLAARGAEAVGSVEDICWEGAAAAGRVSGRVSFRQPGTCRRWSSVPMG